MVQWNKAVAKYSREGVGIKVPSRLQKREVEMLFRQTSEEKEVLTMTSDPRVSI